MILNCQVCSTEYECNVATTRVFGSILETSCPECKNKISKNISAYLFDQVGVARNGIQKATNMIKMAHFVGEKVNDDDLFVRLRAKRRR